MSAHPISPPVNPTIFRDIQEERDLQDRHWGGPDHDDQHDPEDWARLVDLWNQHAVREGALGNMGKWRHKLVQVAAISIAAIQAIDRSAARDGLKL